MILGPYFRVNKFYCFHWRRPQNDNWVGDGGKYSYIPVYIHCKTIDFKRLLVLYVLCVAHVSLC